MGRHKIGGTDQISEGEGICVEVDGIEVAVFNLEGEFHAIQNRCIHKNAPLCKAGRQKKNAPECEVPTRGRVNVESSTVNCPWHWWEWDLKTGSNPVNDMQMRTFLVEIDENDNLWITI